MLLNVHRFMRMEKNKSKTTFHFIKSDFYAWCRWKSKTPSIRRFVEYFCVVENRYIIGRRFENGFLSGGVKSSQE